MYKPTNNLYFQNATCLCSHLVNELIEWFA